MQRARLHQLTSLGLGMVVGTVFHLLGIDLLLSSAVAVALVVTLGLLFRVNREFPGRQSPDSWQDGRRRALTLAVTNFAALVGVQFLPLPGGYNAAVGFLIIVVGLSGYLSGRLTEMERDRPDTDGPTSDRAVPGDD